LQIRPARRRWRGATIQARRNMTHLATVLIVIWLAGLLFLVG
jgi:hypothetical protein